MKIAIGCDPNAEEYKKQLIPFIQGLGHAVTDFGSDDPIYARTAFALGEAVAAKKYDRGILICGTGIGVCIAANKVKGVYAAEVNDIYQARKCHHDRGAGRWYRTGKMSGEGISKKYIRREQSFRM